MKYLFDTNVFLWWMVDPQELPPAVVSLIERKPAEIAFSSICVWEIAIKSSLGKVKGVPVDQIAEEVSSLGWIELPFTMRHAAAAAALPFHHHDPFDRALIAQATVENLVFVTRAPVAPRYGLPTFWE